jgi:hypothetical protein
VLIQFHPGSYVPTFVARSAAQNPQLERLAAGNSGLLFGVFAANDGRLHTGESAARTQGIMQIVAPPFTHGQAELLSRPGTRLFIMRAATDDDLARLHRLR